jgi:hypothetical protein
MAGGRSSSRRATLRPAALAVSAALHAALAVLLGYFLSKTPTYTEPRAIQVTLVAPARREAPPRTERDQPRRLTPRPPVASAGAEVAPLPVAPAPGVAGPAADGEAGRGQRVLQALGRCDRAGLSREERERCETGRWARAGPANARLNLDASGRYAENPEPFLSRRPTKGCRARATGDVNAMGDPGNARAGVTCVIPF